MRRLPSIDESVEAFLDDEDTQDKLRDWAKKILKSHSRRTKDFVNATTICQLESFLMFHFETPIEIGAETQDA